MRAVNLLPKDSGRSSRKSRKPVVLVGLVGGVVMLAGLGGVFIMTSSDLSAKESELANKQAELASMPRPEATPADAAETAETAELAAERAPRVAALSAVLAKRVAWDRILRRFSLVLPDDIWLQTLSVTSPPDAAAAAAAPEAAVPGFSITGRTYSHDGVARLLSRLTALPDLENVQLQGSQITVGGTQKLVEFTIVAGIRAEGASS
jgi:Tfp pilus assembly protein PilN